MAQCSIVSLFFFLVRRVEMGAVTAKVAGTGAYQSCCVDLWLQVPPLQMQMQMHMQARVVRVRVRVRVQVQMQVQVHSTALYCFKVLEGAVATGNLFLDITARL